MKKIAFFIITFVLISNTALAEMILFTSNSCPFCRELETFIEEQGYAPQLSIKEISQNKENADLYIKTSKELGYKNGMVPLLVDEDKYVEGKQPIIEYLYDKLSPALPEVSKNTLTSQESKDLNSILTSGPSSDRDETITKASTDYKTISVVIIAAFLLITAFRIFRKKD